MSDPAVPPPGLDPRDAASHARCRDLIGRHVEGELDPAETAEMFAHLGACASCREVLDAEKRLNDRLRRLPRMVAPSDLRAQILREALRDRERSSSALDAADRLKGILAHEDGAEEGEETAVFEHEPLRTRRHQRFSRSRQWQAVAASVFLVVASVTALLTGDFRGVAPLAQVQQPVREATRTLVSFAMGTGLRRPSEPVLSGVTEVAKPAESRESGSAADAVGPRLVNLRMPRVEDPGRRLNLLITKQLGRVNEAVTRLAEAAEAPMPDPAETARPAIAAIVLRSPRAGEARTFDSDELTEILTAANRDPAMGQRLEVRDQFVFQGRRYRCYRVLVTPEWLEHVTQALDIYRAPAEVPVLRALSDQGHRLPRTDQIAFYTAPASALRAAAGAVPADRQADQSGSPQSLQVIVVDE